MTVQDKLRSYIVEELRFPGQASDLAGDLPLLEREILDSMGILQVVTYLEGEFGIEIDDEDLVAENFATIDAIAGLVESKQS
ncbi:MAG: acyl carrier protein [Acidimicrobiia bacterium]|jgi:acyl carrier protein